MKHYADQDNLHTRIYAMKSRLLTFKDYASLVRDQESFYGKNIGVHDYLETKEVIFREQIATIIHLAEATSDYAPLFIAYLRLYEVNNLKHLLAKALGRHTLGLWYDIGPYAIFSKNLIEEDLSLNQIKELLEGTYLEDVCKDGINYERLEIRADSCAAMNLFASSVKFSPGAKRVFQDFITRRIAILILIRRWRLEENYQWSGAQLRLYLEGLNSVFEASAWQQLKIVEEVLERHLEKMRQRGTLTPAAEDIEHYVEEYYYNWVSSMFHRDFHSLYCVIAYLLLLSYQIKNLFRIIEGLRFNLPPEAILERIITEV